MFSFTTIDLPISYSSQQADLRTDTSIDYVIKQNFYLMTASTIFSLLHYTIRRVGQEYCNYFSVNIVDYEVNIETPTRNVTAAEAMIKFYCFEKFFEKPTIRKMECYVRWK